MANQLRLSAVAGGKTPPCALRATLSVAATHPLLAGHFPGAPVVPGVLLLDAVRAAWAQASARPAVLVGVDEVRWFAPLAPGVEVTLHGQVEAAADAVVVTGEWRSAALRVARFVVRIAPPVGGEGEA